MISIIVCSINESNAQAIYQHYKNMLGDEPHEIISIRDARSLAEAYNRGIDRAIGDILIFSHDDIEFLDPAKWLGRLKAHMIHFDVVGLAGTTRLIWPNWAKAGPPYTFGQIAEPDGKIKSYRVMSFSTPGPAVPDIQGLDGLFFAVKRQVVQKVRFDENVFDGFHCYDTDFTFSVFLAGFKLAVVTDLPVLHASKGKYDAKWEFYADRFLLKHRANLSFPKSTRPFQYEIVGAETKEELLEIMAPHDFQW